MADAVRLRVATWNIHGGVGRDRKYDAERIIAVIRELGADIVALQEVSPVTPDEGLLKDVATVLGVKVVTGPMHTRHGISYGNALLSRFPIVDTSLIDLSVRSHERRGAIDASILMGERAIRVISTHLGLRPYERREQVQRILATLGDSGTSPVILMGDVNEWLLWGRPLRWLHSAFHERKTPATFPSRLPIFALDRIWMRPAEQLLTLAKHGSALAKVASDHLPLVADISLA